MRRLAVVLTALVTMVAGLGVLVTSPSYSASAEAPVTARKAARLHIPAIGVDAGIRRVGVRNGRLAVGGSVRDVYSWRHGVRPGQPGSAVLAGHTWSKGPGVFDRLGQLRPGNRISVGIAAFKVTRVRRVSGLSPAAVRALFSDRGRARLVLITCGDRNNTTGIYRTRIIVTAKKVRRLPAGG
ncbi:class F sortase [Nocardioides seonyuensis]|uniref:class F sortase n=1 Tax=Nocardioides seonyuensis TaxID=2518371 RepID=UPI00142198E1|nr:class F sortase [Nocardioides seonyuensis]